MRPTWLGLVAAAVLLCGAPSEALVILKTIDGHSDCKAFLGRFCFSGSDQDGTATTGGLIDFNIRFPAHHQNLHLVMYYMSDKSWDMVKDNKSTCNSMYHIAKEGGNTFPVAYADSMISTRNGKVTTAQEGGKVCSLCSLSTSEPTNAPFTRTAATPPHSAAAHCNNTAAAHATHDVTPRCGHATARRR